MPDKVKETRKRILDMLGEKRLRRQGNLGELPLVDKVLQKGIKTPKVPRLPKV